MTAHTMTSNIKPALDPVTLQILKSHFEAAAESMGYTLLRTAHSAFVKETEDFTSGLTTPCGQTFASPKDLGATWFIGLDYKGAIDAIADYKPGDICITNDPYSGYVCTHAPDVHLWMPIFEGQTLVCFAVGHIHNTDMGGAVPASLSRALTEVQQEGIRIPPMKLVEEGVMNEQVLAIMLRNVRMPDQNWGDLKAQIASLKTGERKIRDAIARFGVETVCAATYGVLDLADRQARRLFASMQDGDYVFTDYIDEDSPGGVPCRLKLTVRVSGDEAVFDFTGSDPQLQSALNMPTGGLPRHILPLVGYNYVVYSLDPTVALNAGLLRPVRCILPEGSVVNPVYPAATGMRSLTCARIQGMVVGAFSLALPDRLPAGPAGGGGILNVRTTDSRTGRLAMASINPITGGGGGWAKEDGQDGSNSFLKNTPIEITEAEVPIRVISYELVPDSGGAGRYRGGLAAQMTFKMFSPNSVVTARNRDRVRFSCWGLEGGEPGATCTFLRNPGTEREESLGNTDVVRCAPGDTLMISAAGAGGWGDPHTRPVGEVMDDVAQGKVSVEGARRYGVVVVDGKLDDAATHTLRTQPGERPNGLVFDPERLSFEAIWSDEAWDHLSARLFALPIEWRFFLKHEIFALVNADATAKADPVAAIERAYASLLQLYPQIAPRSLGEAA
ncbi:hydantoinase B/oxoprolinase family protein [Bosea sp. 124]|uniref:hydantoinase B/oxoprolinase family protein n=1 Tax=Bosea sp. 124 TaxID=2135642 RepID=UPI000D49B102|nr:hydantoinase B/oxoprolinase family protein [Bosea sp. 124]PTM41667.1 N-methylhydantoinase B [Bosea sp. 124]